MHNDLTFEQKKIHIGQKQKENSLSYATVTTNTKQYYRTVLLEHEEKEIRLYVDFV